MVWTEACYRNDAEVYSIQIAMNYEKGKVFWNSIFFLSPFQKLLKQWLLHHL